MNKGLEALEELQEHWEFDDTPKGFVDERVSIIERELKSLEIIRNKECIFKGLSETTQEEYDLLKEVML